MVLVRGDTSTTPPFLMTALACYYLKILVGHVEAGIRAYDIYSPYPEKFNRQVANIICRFLFSSSEMVKPNLIKEGKKAKMTFVTDNTAINAPKTTVEGLFPSQA